jgi:plastocyanin
MHRLLLSGGLALAASVSVLVAPVFAADPIAHRVILATDNCDPTTFNQAVGPGTCVGHGTTTFQAFLQQVQRLHRAPLWRFVPDSVSLDTDDPVLVKNVGGETHTFTEVAQFGGGVVPVLNQLAGNLTEAPECARPPGEDNHILPPGASFVFTEPEAGTHLYQCCIHPWMHAVLRVREERAGRPT